MSTTSQPQTAGLKNPKASSHFYGLIKAIEIHDYGQVEWLLERGVKPDPTPSIYELARLNPLSIAVMREDLRMVQLLTHYGAHPNPPLPAGQLPLLFDAIRSESSDILKCLLKHGCKTDVMHDLFDVVSYAAIRGAEGCLKILLEHGISPHAIHDNGQNVLGITAHYSHGKGQCLALLVKAGVDLNHQDLEGYTPCMTALMGRSPEAIKTLLSFKPHLDLESLEGRTVWDLLDTEEYAEFRPLFDAAFADKEARDLTRITESPSKRKSTPLVPKRKAI